MSIQVIDKSQNRYRVMRSFGTGRTEAELSHLEAKAHQFIREKQEFIGSLFAEEDELYLEEFISGLSNSHLQVTGPELIFGTLYDKTGYGVIDNEMFRNLVISRLFNLSSKLKMVDYLLRYQGICYSSDKIYRFLDNLCLRNANNKTNTSTNICDIKTQVEEISFKHTKKVLKGKINVVFYDMTTLYFEASDEDDLRKTGFSKDGKHQCPQIFLGLLVASAGNPIGYLLFVRVIISRY
ncbi:MAG: hypothetical protein LBQ31_01515 [Bacteroidales bacterium]|nr:hypothetical protein [Bacteroidales bacterium]